MLVCVVKVLLVFALAVGCRQSETRPPDQKDQKDQKDPKPEQAPTATTGWSRAEWLKVAQRISTTPGPTDAADLQKLVTTEAWKQLDADTFSEVLTFAPAVKQLYTALGQRGAIDDVVALSLYTVDVDVASVRAGAAFVAKIPEDDATRPVRERGLAKVKLGAAIEVCGLLHLATGAKPATRDAALTRLATPEIYADLSREPLQLILATLDEKLLPTIDTTVRPKYDAIRSSVLAAYRARTEPTTTVYQGSERPEFTPRTVVVVSSTGGFSISLGPVTGVVPLARRDGDEHIISLGTMEGTQFEAKCADDIDVADTANQIAALEGTTQRADKVYVLKRGDRDGLVRVDTIHGRGCVISAEGPRATFPATLAEVFVASLRAS